MIKSKISYAKQVKLSKSLIKLFSSGWAKPGADFSAGAIVWSGECCKLIDGSLAFDYHSESAEYEFGVHVTVIEWAKVNGLYFECRDAGTFLAYQS